MANTLSGKLAEYADKIAQINVKSVAENTASAKTLYRYVGIIDKVDLVYSTGNITLDDATALSGLESGERVLLTAQADSAENRVYEREGNELKLVHHQLEDGILVEDLSSSAPNQSMLYQYKATDNTWTPVVLQSGTTSA